MLKNNFPFYNNMMSNWNFFLKKENKKKISCTPGLANWHSVKEFGVKNIIKYLLDNFKKKERLKYSILDVGCNDGYFTERLARLKFKKTIRNLQYLNFRRIKTIISLQLH